MTWASTMRKWSRTIHRDLSYFFLTSSLKKTQYYNWLINNIL